MSKGHFLKIKPLLIGL